MNRDSDRVLQAVEYVKNASENCVLMKHNVGASVFHGQLVMIVKLLHYSECEPSRLLARFWRNYNI